MLSVRELVVTLVTAAIGCGSSGLVFPDAGHDAAAVDASLDVVFTDVLLSGSDAGIDAPEEAPDVGPPVPCEAGDYYITVNYDGGSMVLRDGCGGAPNVPTLGPGICAEDCWPSDVCGASDASTLTMAFGPTFCAGATGIGVYPMEVECNGGYWTVGGTKTVLPGGWVRLKDFPAGGGAVSGDYVVTSSADGGLTMSGTFCVLRTQ